MRISEAAARQEGIALIVCMLMMLVVLMLGTSGAQIAIQEEKASRHEKDRLVALQMAEAALKDAELDIELLPRIDQFEKQKAGLIEGKCEEGWTNPFLGLCRPAAPDMFPVWYRIEPGAHTVSVPYGYFTGRSLEAGGTGAPANTPRYLIEILLPPPAKEDMQNETVSRMYRVTAIGYGAKESTQAVVQAYYRKSHGPTERKGRLSWREILNWEELRDALVQE